MKKDQILVKTTTDFKVSSGKGGTLSQQKDFTLVNGRFKNGIGLPIDKGILGYYTLSELVSFINQIDKSSSKGDAAFLSGYYSGGTTMAHCQSRSDILFFDIDIKKGKENDNLYKSSFDRLIVYEFLKEHSAFVARSSSGIGIFGAISVADLSQFDLASRGDYKKASVSVFRYLEELCFQKEKVRFSFDDAQANFRHLRFGAYQEEKISLNTTPTSFSFEMTTSEVYLDKNVPDFTYAITGEAEVGTIREKFNAANNIEEILPSAGLSHVFGNRWKYNLSESDTSGELVDNTFISNSTTFSGNDNPFFDCFRLTQRVKGYSLGQMYHYCRELGYEDDHVDFEELKKRVKPDLTKEEIFRICHPLKYAPIEERVKYLKDLAPPADQEDIYRAYLRIKKLTINFDRRLKIKKWVSEILPEVFDSADHKKKVLLAADTGSGKTTSIIEDFKKLRPSKRLLVIAPLTAIVDQVDGVTPVEGIIRLKGTVDEKLWFMARRADIVISTHKHATELLKKGIEFDYIVRDEIHSDVLQNSFRGNTISELNYELDQIETPVIGLTGTPSDIFTKLGFYMIKVESNGAKNEIIQRVDNRESHKIILQHQQNVSGRAIYRANSKKSLDLVKTELIKAGLPEESIVILSGDSEVKLGEHYQRLVDHSNFAEEVKVVLTTSVIDEGVSIHDSGFTDVVYIGSDYHPRPEPLKQFLNRFRKKESTMTYYHYRRSVLVQGYKDSRDQYDQDIQFLEDELNDMEKYQETSFSSAASDDRMRYASGEANPYFIAYQNTTRFFESFNDLEFNEYMQINYHVAITVDAVYEKEEIAVQKPSQKDEREKITKLFLESREDIETALYHHTLDKGLKKSLEPHKNGVSEEIDAFVKKNLKYFELLFSSYHLFEQVSDNPNALLLNELQQIESRQNLSRKAGFLKLQKTLQQPDNYRDNREQAKLEKFLKKIKHCESDYSIDDLKKEWISCNLPEYVTVSDYTYKDFVAANTERVWCRKSKTFRIKEEIPTVTESYMKDWLKPFDESFIYSSSKSEDVFQIKKEMINQYKLAI